MSNATRLRIYTEPPPVARHDVKAARHEARILRGYAKLVSDVGLRLLPLSEELMRRAGEAVKSR